jgi:hypothetical protein
VVSGRALALVVLAWSLIKMVAKRAFGAPTGLRLFHANYDADRLPSLSPSEREKIVSFSRCIACGRCDIGEAQRIERSKGQYPGLMAFTLAASRSMPDFDAAAAVLGHVPDEVLAEKESVCPVGMPFVDLARFIREKAEEIRGSSAPANDEEPDPRLVSQARGASSERKLPTLAT